MSFPAEGVDKMYRNDLSTVGQFLKERHGSRFIVINLSCKKYTTYKIFGLKANNMTKELTEQ